VGPDLEFADRAVVTPVLRLASLPRWEAAKQL
jgi:hypothetical protein